uniref:Uncharacterized protein n=1 Tax=viral metagenome TaxID=1070528 RepID=A0A2V0RMR9_9ZZZZ
MKLVLSERDNSGIVPGVCRVVDDHVTCHQLFNTTAGQAWKYGKLSNWTNDKLSKGEIKCDFTGSTDIGDYCYFHSDLNKNDTAQRYAWHNVAVASRDNVTELAYSRNAEYVNHASSHITLSALLTMSATVAVIVVVTANSL